MKERPILFSAPMVRAILEGRKTQTRRVVNPKLFIERDRGNASPVEQSNPNFGKALIRSGYNRYGQPGDRLWVRETHAHCDECGALNFRATNGPAHCLACDQSLSKWKPSIFMFREDSRILLEVTEVRVQRLQEIIFEDALAEGIEMPRLIAGVDVDIDGNFWKPGQDKVIKAFRTLWDSINGKRQGCAWADNPWVWAVSFKKIKP